MHFETTVEVNAPAATLWQAVADIEKWPDWTLSMREVSWLTGGELKPGGRARVVQPGMPPGRCRLRAVCGCRQVGAGCAGVRRVGPA
jgi:hypothetical protein